MPPRLLIQADACQIGLKPDFASGGAVKAGARVGAAHVAGRVHKPDIVRVAQISRPQEAILRSVAAQIVFDQALVCCASGHR